MKVKKAQIRYSSDEETTEVTIVENKEDAENYGEDYCIWPKTLYALLNNVKDYGPVIINSKGGMCNLQHVMGDNKNVEIYEVEE